MATIIHIDGGIIQYVFNVKNDLTPKVMIVDTDIADMFPDPKVITIKDNCGRRISAFVSEIEVDELDEGCDIDLLVKEYIKNKKQLTNG